MNAVDANEITRSDAVDSMPASSVTAPRVPTVPLPATDDRDQLLAEVLQPMATELCPSGAGQWRFSMEGTKRSVTVTRSEHWLTISLPLRNLSGPLDIKAVSAMLKRNGRIMACPRLVGLGLGCQRQFLIEFPMDALSWDVPFELEAQLAVALSELYGAAARSPDQQQPSGMPGLSLEQIQALCRDAGWLPQLAGDQALEISLDVPGHYLPAQISQVSGSVRLSLALLQSEFASASPEGRAAVLVLLWVVACRVRMIKPVLMGGVLGIEVLLPENYLNGASIAHACRALSFTAQQFIPEAQLLSKDESLAQMYLNNMGFSLALGRMGRPTPIT